MCGYIELGRSAVAQRSGCANSPRAFLKSNPHPRAYGNFARLLGRYVRDEGVIPLQEAVRREGAAGAHESLAEFGRMTGTAGYIELGAASSRYGL